MGLDYNLDSNTWDSQMRLLNRILELGTLGYVLIMHIRGPNRNPDLTHLVYRKVFKQQQVLQKLQKFEEVQAQIVDRLANLAKSSPTSWVGPADLQEPLTEPIKSIQEFDMLETKLAESDFEKRMINYLSLIGGVNIAQTSRRIMKKLGSNNLWSDFNLFGLKGKRGLKSTRFYPVIVRACVKTHQGVKETDIEEVLGDFLKRTPYLPGGSKWRVNSFCFFTGYHAKSKV
nr:uncharacterized protein LOC129266559 [Lytechinus pictus]